MNIGIKHRHRRPPSPFAMARQVLMSMMLLVIWVCPARAEVVLTLSAHPGLKVAGIYSLYPHAFIHLAGTVDATGEVVDEWIGFGATSFGPHLLFSRVPGEIGKPGNLQIDGGTDYLSLPISDEVYAAIRTQIDYWKTPEGGTYDLRRRNCIHFVMDMARLAGLQVPPINPMSPNETMIAAAALNPAWSLGPEGMAHAARVAQAAEPAPRVATGD